MPIILPATHPLPAAQRVEFGGWIADKLREAHALNPAGAPVPIVITSDHLDAVEIERVKHALANNRAKGFLNFAPADPEPWPWPFSLVELKARLR